MIVDDIQGPCFDGFEVIFERNTGDINESVEAFEINLRALNLCQLVRSVDSICPYQGHTPSDPDSGLQCIKYPKEILELRHSLPVEKYWISIRPAVNFMLSLRQLKHRAKQGGILAQ